MAAVLDQLDLDLAWRRTKSDLQSGRVFVHAPLETELIDVDEKLWLNGLRQKIQKGYQPGSATLADIPKGNGAVRPGAMLSLEDRVVYAALVGALLPKINDGLIWSQGKVDFSYRLSGTLRRVDWFTNTFNAWTAFRNASLKRIDDGAAFVVTTDITGFYENIDLTVLLSDLRNLGCSANITELLARCLYRWCVLPGRGVPQGLSASDILAKVYLNPVDQAMVDDNIDYTRYVDDIRIFCKNQPDGKIALMRLIQLLRRRGLNLQSAKTSIVYAETARNKIEGISPLISKVQKQYQKEFRDATRFTYTSFAAPERETKKASSTPPEIIRTIFQDHFLRQSHLDKTLLHFLLKRLGDQRDDVAVDYCLKLMVEHPQETNPALTYLATASARRQNIFSAIEAYLASPESIYDFQTYQIFSWLNSLKVAPSPRLIAAAREYTFDHSKPNYLRSVCRVVLQNYGSFADLERLEGSYGSANSEFEKAQIIVSVKRMEARRRNAFFGRVSGDGMLCDRACKLVKDGRL